MKKLFYFILCIISALLICFSIFFSIRHRIIYQQSQYKNIISNSAEVNNLYFISNRYLYIWEVVYYDEVLEKIQYTYVIKTISELNSLNIFNNVIYGNYRIFLELNYLYVDNELTNIQRNVIFKKSIKRNNYKLKWR